MTETSIYDLLKEDDQPQRRKREALSGVRWWVTTVLVAAALTAVALLGLRTVNLGAPAVSVFTGILALLILRRLTAQVAPPPSTRDRAHHGRHDDSAYQLGDPDGLRRAVHRWERKLYWGDGEPQRHRQGMHRALAELVDERLRQRHGCTRATDPVRARALLGEPLWNFLADPGQRTPTPRRYAALLAELEKI